MNVNTEFVSQEDVLQWAEKEKEELSLTTRNSNGGYRFSSVYTCMYVHMYAHLAHRYLCL